MSEESAAVDAAPTATETVAQPETTATTGNLAAAPETAPTWTEGFSEAELGHALNKGWKTPQDAMQGAMNAESHIGYPADRLVKLPSDPSEPGAMNAVYDQMGRPTDSAGYEFSDVPETLAEGSDDMVNMFRGLAHERGLSQEQAAGVYDGFMEFQAKSLETMATRTMETNLAQEAELKRDWGQSFPDNVQIGKAAAGQLGITGEQIDGLEDSLGTRGTLELLHKLGMSLSVTEHGFTPAGNETNTFGMSAGSAAARHAALKQEVMDDPARAAVFLEGKGSDFKRLTELSLAANQE